MQDNLILSLVESAGSNRKNEFVQIGIPLPAGEFYHSGEIQLLQGDELLPAEKQASVFWPDGSIKWCLLKFFVSLASNKTSHVFLRKVDNTQQPASFKDIVQFKDEKIEVQTQNYRFRLDKNQPILFEQVARDDQIIAEKSYCRLQVKGGEWFNASVDDFNYRPAYSEQGPLYSEIHMSGQFRSVSESIELNFDLRMYFYFLSDQVEYVFTLHNPERAVHPSGLWDLGDINSVYIEDFSLGFEISDRSEVKWKTELNKDWSKLKTDSLHIYQESSGGENWNSPNHKNKDDHIPMKIKGYICTHDNVTDKGDRASPVVCTGKGTGRIEVSLDKFWQNFPKSLGVDGNRVELGLFPQDFPDVIELQPGEKKTHRFYLRLGEQDDAEDIKYEHLTLILNPDWLRQCDEIPYLFSDPEEDAIEQIIQQGLTGKDNFFVKRERIDEYGWRNFGDLFADHETDLYSGDEIFVSHYNNQYDPLYGFLKQYLLTGENKWFELADDLAKHIVDIDIYHTKKDKVEYSGGPFWHTDHYLDAKTSSHRGFSRQHNYVYEGHAGGGGPSGEHCYTTGLLYHYLLTGCEASKQAVLQLSNWATCYYEGSNTFFDFIIAIKNIRGRGIKNILTGRYSLDRGTGYYVNALLDKYYLTRDRLVLLQAENIIRNTVHPCDDLVARDLGNVEIRWFYTIFLQYMCRYLEFKEELSELDDQFYYARDTLLHYADWMLENEQPYLEKPEVLEFPNHTWTAQDIRKVNLLFYASQYANEQPDKYLHKANELLQYIILNLYSEATRTYTRILAILMQNYIPSSAYKKAGTAGKYAGIRQYQALDTDSKITAAKNLLSSLLKVMRHFSISREITWLKKRTSFFQRKENT